MGIKQCEAGSNFSMVLMEDGKLLFWGADLTAESQASIYHLKPSPFTHLSDNIALISAGQLEACALAMDGTLWWWGWRWSIDIDGYRTIGPIQLDFSSVEMPRIIDLTIDAIEVVALTEDGQVWHWYRQTMASDQFTGPARVPSLSGISSIRSSYTYHTALDRQGFVWIRQLNDIGKTSLDVIRHPHLTGIKQISGGSSYSICLKEDGTVWMFGKAAPLHPVVKSVDSNSLSLTQIKGIDQEVVLIATGSPAGHGVTLTQDNKLWGWGRNDVGQLGSSPHGNMHFWSEAKLIDTPVAMKSVVLGASHTLAVGVDNSLWGWGNNSAGQLGIGTRDNQFSPLGIELFHHE